jgi:hypothetical protein
VVRVDGEFKVLVDDEIVVDDGGLAPWASFLQP